MGWLRDARISLRSLLRRPAAPAAIIGILALGIGAITATFAVFNTVLFRPIPGVDRPDDLVTVRLQPRDRSRSFSSFSRDHFVAMRDAEAGLTGLTSEWGADRWVFPSGAAEPELLRVAGVARAYASVLGLRTRIGRQIADEEAETPGHRVAVISERLWRKSFGASASVVGQTLSVNDEPFSVVGVVSQYRGWSLVFKYDVWLPMAEWPAVDRRTKPDKLWDNGFFDVFGRLRPGVAPESVEPRLGAAFAHVDEVTGKARQVPLTPVVSRGLANVSQRSIETKLVDIFRVMSIGALVLLVLACANAANLLVVRSTRRRSELALRAALGGGRWRLLRLLVVEAAELTIAAGVLGLFFAIVLGGTFRGTPLLPYLPALDEIGLDARVLAFCATVSGLTVFVFGVAPAWLATSVDPRRLLLDSRAVTRSTHWLGAGLVAVQVALSLALVVSAMVLYRSLDNLRSQEMGYRAAHVVEFDLETADRGYTATQRARLYQASLDRLRAMPGAEHVGFSSPAPLSTSSVRAEVRSWNRQTDEPITGTAAVVSPDYFATLSIPLLDGRDFRADEFMNPVPESSPVIVSFGLAQQLFGSAPAVGQRVVLGTGTSARAADVVGVVGDVKSGDLRADPRRMIYRPSEPDFVFGTILVRSSQPADQAIAATRAAMREVAPGIPLFDVGTLDADIDHQLVEERVIARLIGLVAVIAWVVAFAGLYAVVAHLVVERTRELGIRIALGAPLASITRIVLRRVVALTLAGAAIGVGLILASTRFLAARVYHVSPSDPVTVAAAIVALVAAALVAAWRPAKRATKIDPVVALRVD